MLTDFQKFCIAGKHMKFATKPCDITHLTLGILLHYRGKLLIQIFCRYSAGMAEMQTNCILIASNFVIHPQISIFLVFKVASLSPYRLQIKFLSTSCPTMLTVDKHCSDVCCDEFPVPQIDRKSK